MTTLKNILGAATELNRIISKRSEKSELEKWRLVQRHTRLVVLVFEPTYLMDLQAKILVKELPAVPNK